MFRKTLSLLILLSLSAGCSRKEEPEFTWIGLIDLFDCADSIPETQGITFGEDTPPDTLGKGFYHIEIGPDGRDFIWAGGEEALVHPWLGEPLDRVLTLTLRPFPVSEMAQELDILWEGTPVARVSLNRSPEWQTLRFPIPAAIQKPGRNQLRFGFSHSHVPADILPDNLDTRSLSVAFDALVIDRDGGFRPGRPVPAGRIELDAADTRDILRFVTPGELRYSLILRQESRLYLNWRGNGQLSISGRKPDEEPTEFLRVSSTRSDQWKEIDIPLKGLHGGPCQLTFTVSRGSVELAAPGILVPGKDVVSDLFGLAAEKQPSSPAPVLARPSILFLLIDTLRADQLSGYGYPRPTSPHLDMLAEKGVLFEDAYSHNPWTKNSMAALMTGRYPSAVGMTGLNEALPLEIDTLPECLTAAGYTCIAISTNGFMSDKYRFDQGFREFIYLKEDPDRPEVHVPSNEVTDRALELLPTLAESKPFFFYIHYMDPHSPYLPEKETFKRFDRGYEGEANGTAAYLESIHNRHRIPSEEDIRHLVDLYDAQIAYNDAQIGRLLEGFREAGLAENLLIVVTSDHGEEFMEHGNLEHARALHRESLHIPLIFSGPGIHTGKRVPGYVAHVDLLPTLCKIAGAEIPEGVSGRSLSGFLFSNEKVSRGHVFSELNLESMVSLRRNETTTIVSRPGRDWREDPLPVVQYFLDRGDPWERDNRASDFPVRSGLEAAAARFLHEMERKTWQAMNATTDEVQPDEERLRILRALGYGK